MHTRFRLSTFLLIMLSSLTALSVLAAPTPPTRFPQLARNARQAHDATHIIVRLRPAAAHAALPPGARPIFGDWYELPVPRGERVTAALERWLSHPAVLEAELNLIVHPEGLTAATPNDPLFPIQWHLPAIEAPQAWERSTGRGVVVAVIDTGLSVGPDLACRSLLSPYNALSLQLGLAAVTDTNGHGTHVAGTIAQCSNNGHGVAGVAYEAALMPIKVCDDSGCTLAAIARGLDWARQQGADVINMSLGSDCAGVGDGNWPDCSSSMVNQALEAAAAADIVLVAAAGNANQSVVGYPANHPAVIAVGALDAAFERAPYSSYGTALSLMAPGGDLSRDLNGDGYPDGVLQETLGSACGSPQSYAYCLFQGTSMAAPHVAGAAALLRAAAPQAQRAAIQQALEQTARDGGAAGFDQFYGYGAIRVDAALTALDVQTAAATNTPTTTRTPTVTPTVTNTPTPSNTATHSNTNTPTITTTPTAVAAHATPTNTANNTTTPQHQIYLPLVLR